MPRSQNYLVATIVMALLAMTTLVALAAERASTFQMDIIVPGQNVEIVGTLSVDYEDTTCEGTWSFQGTVNGELAQASGNGTCAFAREVVSLTVTEIDMWEVEGFEPYTPRTVTISLPDDAPSEGVDSVAASFSYDGRVIDVFGIPITLSRGLAAPVEGTYIVVSDIAAEGEAVGGEDAEGEDGDGGGGGEIDGTADEIGGAESDDNASAEDTPSTLPNAGVRPEGPADTNSLLSILAALATLVIGRFLWRAGWLHPLGGRE